MTAVGPVGRLGRTVFIFLQILLAIRISVVQAQYGTVAGAWKVSYGHEGTELVVGSKTVRQVDIKIYDVEVSGDVDFYFKILIENKKLASTDTTVQKSELVQEIPGGKAHWEGQIEVQGHYFGFTYLYVELRPATGTDERTEQQLHITVPREEHLDDKIFTYSAGALVLLMFINLGTVLDLQRFKEILIKPIGPFIGFCTRYVLMPALALGLGQLFFRTNKQLQLALFITALAPSGGLANICVVFLKGNINLSIATTTINSLMALAMLPLWVIVLARVMFDDSTLTVPFVHLAVGAVALIVAIGLGATLRILFPKTTRYIFCFLKPLSVVLSLCLVGLAVGINAFIFKELTLWICLAAFSLPILGYLMTYFLAKLLCRSTTDSLTLAIETSVLNMTAPIVMLQYTLGNPKGDLIIVMPIIAALTSLILVLILYIVRRIFGWNTKADSDAFDEKKLLNSVDTKPLVI